MVLGFVVMITDWFGCTGKTGIAGFRDPESCAKSQLKKISQLNKADVKKKKFKKLKTK